MARIEDYIYEKEVDLENHIIANYFLEGEDFDKAAKAIAIGQSIGNPDVRTKRDTVRILKNNLAKIVDTPENLHSKKSGNVEIAYPLQNFGEGDGITHLLCTVICGQMDIDSITSCRLTEIKFPQKYLAQYAGPKYGMQKIKKMTGAVNRPLLGGIVKPKTGITVPELGELVEELLEGGVDFIKEDEILANPNFCKFRDRIPVISDLVQEYEQKQNRKIFYAPCINGDYPHFVERAKFASEHEGIRAVHLNFHAGPGAYKVLRDLDLESAIFFQKSGDKILTDGNHRFGIDWSVVNKLARMSGADFIHAGMWGGYSSYSFENLEKILHELRDGDLYKQTIPSLSCGSHPGLVDTTRYHFGDDLMMNVGGAIQGHPYGTTAGAKAMRQAMDKPLSENIFSYMQNKPELKKAIETWGYIEPRSGKLLYKK